ncbi:TPA: arsenate reductase family protein [Streptococcus equi subsp. zooepidemicus]|nr:arsenate reductase family protein [Streptococcus equi subsp. zooepidemicus]
MITIYQYPKCSTCQKALAELKTLVSEVDVIDIKANLPKAEQLKQWLEHSDYSLKSFFNTSGMRYRELGLKDKVNSLSIEEAAELLATDGMLIKRPILLQDNQVLQVGYRTAYKDLGL